ncbi:TrbI/VirB10 family protein [Hyphomonas pacifica]|uniref:Conjugal transfer protein TraI n=1 Tax=Hyphomonas pacifica TaxID=1280941 RepID=A0A062TTF9_9PROT|nr:TrbI/VirB10 family protein [Hyphomonas pacifica]KCZ51266.1 conjugal transfer protein TraI [Hyphomonas pacifica]RAN31432.1 conjugal transfer protein TraI [Hyphomonas pacifica]
MSEDTEHPEEKEIAASLRLRADPPRVMRLSRRTLTVLGAASGLGLGAILIVALQDRKPADGPSELYLTERIQEAEGLSRLPADYTGVPRLGPPLPGELGRPILSAQQRGQSVPTVVTTPTVDPEEQRRLQEIEAARLSRLFAEAKTTTGGQPQTPPTVAPVPSGTGSFFPASAMGASPDATDRRQAFLDKPTDRRTTSTDRLTDPPSPYLVQAGAVIPAALVTGLRSDLPGQITAQVTSNVYDSPTGRFLLIPQGSRLIGEYDSGVAFGQSRVLLAWTRLILPNGRSIVLERQPGADEAGYAGLEDGVNNHWGRLFMAAGLATILNIGAELGADDDDGIARAIREGTQHTIGRAGDEVVRRQLSIPPTLTIRPGFPVRVMVTHDLVLEPYRS